MLNNAGVMWFLQPLVASVFIQGVLGPNSGNENLKKKPHRSSGSDVFIENLHCYYVEGERAGKVCIRSE